MYKCVQDILTDHNIQYHGFSGVRYFVELILLNKASKKECDLSLDGYAEEMFEPLLCDDDGFIIDVSMKRSGTNCCAPTLEAAQKLYDESIHGTTHWYGLSMGLSKLTDSKYLVIHFGNDLAKPLYFWWEDEYGSVLTRLVI